MNIFIRNNLKNKQLILTILITSISEINFVIKNLYIKK